MFDRTMREDTDKNGYSKINNSATLEANSSLYQNSTETTYTTLDIIRTSETWCSNQTDSGFP